MSTDVEAPRTEYRLNYKCDLRGSSLAVVGAPIAPNLYGMPRYVAAVTYDPTADRTTLHIESGRYENKATS